AQTAGRNRAIQGRVYPRYPLDRERGGAGDYYAGRSHHPHRRLQGRPHAHRPGYTESERAVRPRMEEIFNRADKRVVVSCFSSSIHRIQLVLDLAQEYNRRVAVFGRSMVTVTEIAHSL